MFRSQLEPFGKRLFERLADIDIALGSDRNSILFDRN